MNLVETYVRQHMVFGLSDSVISSLGLTAGHKVAGETEPQQYTHCLAWDSRIW